MTTPDPSFTIPKLSEGIHHNDFGTNVFRSESPLIETDSEGHIVAMTGCEVYPVGSKGAESLASYRRGMNDMSIAFASLLALMAAGLFVAIFILRREAKHEEKARDPYPVWDIWPAHVEPSEGTRWTSQKGTGE